MFEKRQQTNENKNKFTITTANKKVENHFI